MLFTCVILASVINSVLCNKAGYVDESNPNIPTIPCIANPLNAVCPMDHKVPDGSKIPGKMGETLKMIYNNTKIISYLSIFMKLPNGTRVNTSCKNSIKTFFCSRAAIICNDSDDFVSRNDANVLTLCKKARSDCTGLPEMVLNTLNCSSLEKVDKKPRRPICVDFPEVKNDPLPCPKRNYKVTGLIDLKERARLQVLAHNLLKNTPIDDQKCLTDTTNAVCKLVAPACTKDKTKVVQFFSKQDCKNIMGCLNATKNSLLIMRAFQMCDRLPDGKTAKRISLSEVFTSVSEVFTSEKPTTKTDEGSTAAAQGFFTILLIISYFVTLVNM